MHPFTLERPRDLVAAIHLGSAPDGRATEYIAGGTDMVALLRDGIRHPERLVAVGKDVIDNGIEVRADGALRLGAAARMSDVAEHSGAREAAPLVAEAILASASQQIRNMASLGGNLLQRTRCAYFRDAGTAACNKRRPGSGCAAMEGDNRLHAVLGGSAQCVATHASDLAVALIALDATLVLRGPRGERVIPLDGFYRLPGDTPDVETVLEPGELIVAILVPAARRLARRAHYLKLRDRASFEFALVSAAVALDVEGDRIRASRVAMGGVATKPWRMRAVEDALVGLPLDTAAYRRAAAIAGAHAMPLRHNAFKLELMRRAIVRALEVAGSRA